MSAGQVLYNAQIPFSLESGLLLKHSLDVYFFFRFIGNRRYAFDFVERNRFRHHRSSCLLAHLELAL